MLKDIIFLVSFALFSPLVWSYSSHFVENKIQDIQERSEIVIRVESSKALKSLKNTFLKPVKIVSYYENLYLIQFSEPLNELELNKIRSQKGVKSAQYNFRFKHAYNEQGPTPQSQDCDGLQSSILPSKFSQDVGFFFRNVEVQPLSCFKPESCDDLILEEAFWAQKRVNKDEMLDVLEKWGLLNDKSNDRVKVAILDTGLDVRGLLKRKLIAEGAEFSVDTGFPDAGDPTRDETGHGTPIFSLFRGRDIALAPNAKLTVMRVVGKGRSSRTSQAAIEASVQKACDQGNSIIVLSWGRNSEENGQETYFDKDFKKNLLENGCTVVRAAGNSSRRDVTRQSGALDVVDLTVSALDSTGSYSEFSSRGTVSAPGKNVYSYSSSDPERLMDEKKCATKPGVFIDGTSFAGPIAAAILTQVETVLRTHPRYLKLPPPQRLALRNAIMKASEFGGSVNGLRAVLIAKNWDGQQDVSLEKLQSLISQPTSHPICSTPFQDCETQQCPEIKTCINNNSTRLKTCSVTPHPSQLNKHISQLHSFAGMTEGLDWFQFVRNSPLVTKKEKDLFFQKLWKIQYPHFALSINTSQSNPEDVFKFLRVTLPSHTGIRLAPEVIRSFKDTPNGKREALDIASIVLRSNSFSDSIYKDSYESWETLDKQNEFKEIFQALAEMGDDVFKNALLDWIKADPKYELPLVEIKFGKMPLSDKKIGEILWGLNGLINDPRFEKYSFILKRHQQDFLRKANEGEIFLSEAPFSLIANMMDQEKMHHLQRAHESIKDGRVDKLGHLDIRYVTRNVLELNENIYPFLTQTIAPNTLRIESDNNRWLIFEQALHSAVALSDRNLHGMETFKDTFEKAIYESNDISFLLTVFRNFRGYLNYMSQLTTEQKEQALKEIKLLGMIFDQNLNLSLVKRLASLVLSDPEKYNLSIYTEFQIVNYLDIFPDNQIKLLAPLSGAHSMYPSSQESGGRDLQSSWIPYSSRELIDQLVANRIYKLRNLLRSSNKNDKQNDFKRKEISENEAYLSRIQRLFSISEKSDGSRWKKTLEAARKFRQDSKVQLLTPDKNLQELLEKKK